MDFSIIKRMTDTRTDHDQTQKELAAALGIHRVQLAKYENGTNTPSMEYLKKFCNYYHVSADYILGLPRNFDRPRE